MGQHKHNPVAIAAAKGELLSKLYRQCVAKIARISVGMKKMTRTAQIGEGFQTRSLTGIAATENGGKNKG